MPEFATRAAKKQDCRTIAELYRIASDGVADYIWSTLAEPGQDILQVGQLRYEREDSVFSYLNATIIELDATIIGMLVAFPAQIDTTYVEEDPVLAPYSILEEPDSHYVCAMAILPEFRGRGAGSELLKIAEEQAAELRLDKMSLIVFEQNTGAKRLYERHGYVERKRGRVVPHALIKYTGDALLMVKHLRGSEALRVNTSRSQSQTGQPDKNDSLAGRS